MVHKVCCVPGCKNNSEHNPDLAYHHMPKRDQLRKEWLASIGTPALVVKPFTTLKGLQVCSKHFTVSQYQFPGSQKLNFGAVPCIFEPLTLTLPARLSALLQETIHNAGDTPTIDLPEASGESVALEPPVASHPPSTHAEGTNNIAELRQLLAFKDSDNVTDCSESSNTTEFDNEIVITRDGQQQDNPHCAEDTAGELTTEQLSTIIRMVQKVCNHVRAVDPNIARGLFFRRAINNAMHCYRKAYVRKLAKNN